MKKLLVLLSFLLVIGSGCTHKMRVLNLDDYDVLPSSGPSMKVAITPYKGDADQMRYFRAIVTGLRNHPMVSDVRTDYVRSNQNEEPPTEVLSLQVDAKYSGSPANFFITFPGFIVFACAWSGYHYKADIVAKFTLANNATEDLTQFASPANKGLAWDEAKFAFKLRHCDFERGFWSGTGWWIPGYGIHNVITGAILTKYDPDATSEFHDKADKTIGTYVAEKIVLLIRTGKSNKAVATLAESR